MKHLLLISLLFTCFAVSSHAQEVYKTVDENGKVIFSDKPKGEDSEKVDTKLKNVQPGTVVQPYEKKKKDSTKTSIRIVSPSDGQQFGPTQKSISISAKVFPKLSSKHRVTIYFDGKVISGPSQSTSASVPLSIKVRGKHTISATVTDESGNTVAQSGSISVQVIRP